MAKLSIIIPVYNVEKYLKRCLDSVIKQTFKDVEIIIINDASTDNSQEIIDEYKLKDSRIISVVNNKNKKVGETRNIGINLAKGEYISFIDSDDWVEENMYEQLINLTINNKVSVVESNFKSTNLKDNKLCLKLPTPYFKKSNSSIARYITHLYKEELGVSVCNKIYKTKIIKENNIRFENYKLTFGEDLLFNLQIMHYVDVILTINKPLYNYYYRNESISNKGDFINLEMTIYMINKFIENNKNFVDFESDFYAFSIMVVPFIKYSVFSKMKDSTSQIKDGLGILKEINDNELLSLVINNSLKNKNLPFIDKIFCLLIKLKLNYVIVISVVIIRNLIRYFNKVIFKINKYFLQNIIKTNISQ